MLKPCYFFVLFFSQFWKDPDAQKAMMEEATHWEDRIFWFIQCCHDYCALKKIQGMPNKTHLSSETFPWKQFVECGVVTNTKRYAYFKRWSLIWDIQIHNYNINTLLKKLLFIFSCHLNTECELNVLKLWQV